MISGVGHDVSKSVSMAGYTIRVFLQALGYVFPVLLEKGGFRSIVSQMYFCGVKAIGVTSVVALFMGMIVSLQGGIELKRFQQAELIGAAVAVSMCREMGPMITAIILTAMIGSTIAAELGTMKVSEEIDALEVMAIDPVRLLVTPRLVGLTVMTFALTILVDLVGILGGGIVAVAQLDVSFDRYIESAQTILTGRDFLGFAPMDVYTGLVKSLVFGALIASVACAQGLTARGGPLGVGRCVRRTVVASIVLILIFGYEMTALFYG